MGKRNSEFPANTSIEGMHVTSHAVSGGGEQGVVEGVVVICRDDARAYAGIQPMYCERSNPSRDYCANETVLGLELRERC